MVSKVNSLSIFFPCRNEKGTILNLVLEAKRVAKTLTDDFEIIVVDDGSTDGSREALIELQKSISELRLIFHEKNRGYGGALRSGFEAATKNFIFYTDGDGQYDVNELTKLAEKMNENIDIVNGYKIKRSDSLHRIIIGFLYQCLASWFFWMPIKDPDCDFRLMRRKIFNVINLTSNTGTICIELIKKIEMAGFKFAEVGVHHYFRIYGKSQFFNFRTISLTLLRLVFLWCELFLTKRPILKEINDA